MTVETKIDPSRKMTSDWAPKARRHGERAGWVEKPQAWQETGEELVFSPASPPPVWPRIFPGI